MKNWGFDDPFYKKCPALVILVPVVMIRPSGWFFFLRTGVLEAFEASMVAEAAEVNRAAEVTKALRSEAAEASLCKMLLF